LKLRAPRSGKQLVSWKSAILPKAQRISILREADERLSQRKRVYITVGEELAGLAAHGIEHVTLKDVRAAVMRRLKAADANFVPAQGFKVDLRDAVMDHMAEAPAGQPAWDRRVCESVHPRRRVWSAEDSRALLAELKSLQRVPKTHEEWVSVARRIGRWKRGTDSKDGYQTRTVRQKARVLLDPKACQKLLYAPALRAISAAATAAAGKGERPTVLPP